MSDPNFDPYHEWLGIPPDEQPANHYRLLGLELFEDDRGVIESVSLEQIAHVRTFAIGANSEQSQLLLNELSAARLTLLSAVQKADYDQELRQQLNISPPPIEAISESTQQPVSASPPSAAPRPEVARSEHIERATSGPNGKQKLYISVGAGIALTLVILVCSIYYLRARRVNQAVAQALSQGDYQAALELDPANGQALSMRRTAELVRFALNRRDHREVVRLDPTNAQGLELKKAADLRQALADGDYSRALEIDATNAEALEMKNAAELRQAMEKGDYARALEIDPTNAEALEMKKSADLRQALADGDYARALEIDLTNAEALEMKDAADLRQALADGDYFRALAIDLTNAEALEMKKSADVRQALADGDYARALEIDPANPAALAMTRGPEKAIAPFDAAKAKQHHEAWAKYLGIEVETENSIGMKLSVIPAGKFTMGEGNDAHEVTLAKPFMLGTYEVTQDQYEKVMGVNPSKVKGAKNPVEMVSWNDAVEFCRKLSELPAEKSAGNVYRLPTEAEWELACRAGTTTKYSFGDDDSELGNYAWIIHNSGRETHPVGMKLPNAWGLYDMHGNVFEWCQDRYGDYPSGTVTDPTGATLGSRRIARGGSWESNHSNCRSAFRGRAEPSFHREHTGFRVSLSPSGKQIDASTALADMARTGEDSTTPPAAPSTVPRTAIAPFDAAKAKTHQEEWAKYLGVEVETENSIGMKLSVIPAGTFRMGEGDDAHEVTLTKPFMLGTYEVTQDQYKKVMGVNPSKFKGARNPVEHVSWNDAVEFCRKLSELPAEKAAGNVYRLPTEAEWEYACRAGTTTRYSFGDRESELGDYGWFRGTSSNRTHPVGGKQPNALGLFDMHGNVWEWCQDWYGNYPSGTVTDPRGATSGSYRVCRGGGWIRPAEYCRSAFRGRLVPQFRSHDFGFRVSLSPSGKQLDAGTDEADMAPKADDTSAPPDASNTAPPPAIAPFDAAKAKEHQEAWAKYLDVEVETENSIGMKLRVIPPGTFTMGSDDDESRDHEKPLHQVLLTKPFVLGTTEVTQGQYEKVMGVNPSRFKSMDNPVGGVSWNDAVEFCARLSNLAPEKLAGRVYQLPTEAQWEYACRAGTTTKFGYGNNGLDLGTYAWYGNNSRGRSHPVGIKQPNGWGIHDMHGNAREWCSDPYGTYPIEVATDPTGSIESRFRVLRGGSFNTASLICRSAHRMRHEPDVKYSNDGLRVVCIVSPKNTFAGVAAASIGAGDAGSLMTSPNSSNNAPPPAIAPFDAAKAKEHQEAWAKYLDVEVETENSIGMKLSVIPAGTFIMGEAGVAHEVTLTKPFMLGTYEVTQGQYQRVMGTNPSKFKEANNPVETLSWDEAVEFCRRLSELPAEKAVGNIYHLPTEAEWEFACRAGTTTRYSFGDNESELGTYGWFSLNSGRKAHPVGGKQPNALGLFDIHGNVREWCQDRRGAYPSGAVTDPTGPTTGSARVFRGGSWGNAADRCRSAYCMGYLPSPGDFYLGFRVCLSPSGK